MHAWIVCLLYYVYFESLAGLVAKCSQNYSILKKNLLGRIVASTTINRTYRRAGQSSISVICFLWLCES